MFKAPTLNKKKKKKKKKIALKNGKNFKCPWTDLSWTMLVTWRLLLINFEAFNVSRSATEIWFIATKLLATRYFNQTNQVAIQCMLADWAHVQGGSVVQREQHEYDVKEKH